MRTLIALRGLAPLAALLLVPLLSPAQGQVDVRVVKYAGLGEVIKQLKGKVVVVDFWADY